MTIKIEIANKDDESLLNFTTPYKETRNVFIDKANDVRTMENAWKGGKSLN